MKMILILSLYEITKTLTNSPNIIKKMVPFIGATYNPIEDYREKLLYQGKDINVYNGDHSITGKFIGLTSSGFLTLGLRNNSYQIVTSGEICPKPKKVIQL